MTVKWETMNTICSAGPHGVVEPLIPELGILVAEDDPNDRFLLQRAFSQAGVKAKVVWMKDGIDAREYLASTQPFGNGSGAPAPSMLVSDLKMPRLDGFGLLAWITSQPELEGMLLVALSSSHLEADRERAYALGADFYMVKPTEPSKLVTLVQDLEQFWCWSCLELGTEALPRYRP
jgi:CheY-like chemotaxis protein